MYFSKCWFLIETVLYYGLILSDDIFVLIFDQFLALHICIRWLKSIAIYLWKIWDSVYKWCQTNLDFFDPLPPLSRTYALWIMILCYNMAYPLPLFDWHHLWMDPKNFMKLSNWVGSIQNYLVFEKSAHSWFLTF